MQIGVLDANDDQQQNRSFVDQQHQVEVSTEMAVSEPANSEECSSKNLSNDTKGDRISAGMDLTEDMVAEAPGQQGENEIFEIEIVPSSFDGRNFSSEASAHADIREIPITRKDEENAIGSSPEYLEVGIGWEGNQLASSVASLASEDFFDAPDRPFDDSASEYEAVSGVRGCPIKSEEQRLQEEIARRTRAEEALASLQLQWEKMARRCSLIGISLSSGLCPDGQMESLGEEIDPFEHFSEKLMVARLVGGAIASAAVRAVKEEECESTVIDKNREISRLRDKLQYYELVNHEMSQRNQEAMEVAQRRKRRCRRRQKWALGFLGAACCIGTTGLLCYKYFPWEQARTWAKPLNGLLKMEPSSVELGST